MKGIILAERTPMTNLSTGFFPTSIQGVLVRRPRVFHDPRGTFREAWNRAEFAQHGIEWDFCQDNVATSIRAGTVRGLHYQRPPAQQAKLVWVLSGAVLDVAVDLREGSPTYGRHVAERLTAEGGEQMLIPVGFAHGYATLEPNTVVIYKVDAPYAPAAEGGLAWDDPALGIDWMLPPEGAQIADRDRMLPRLSELPKGLFHRP